ncbi:MAG: bifunctional diaminohydroxyphosphoribosylaminopyrimidine deaminase/5-amino-6-(5-phosphoribosylamino)uracil reductase RibD [Pseudomonadota bacterium]
MQHVDEYFMREALRQARKGLGRTSPNPAVGAVIVRHGQIIASAFHRKAGEDHAEVAALKKIDGKAKKGDTLYVTLEPCHHYGRTPPCTKAILNSGLKRVVVGMRDPNPHVQGGGCGYLASNGVKTSVGVLESECGRLNESFVKFVTTNRPFVVAKSAMTLDGWIATATGHSKWITNERSRRFVHHLRDRLDGVMVGIGTILADNPLLTTRLNHRKGKDPIRIIVDTHLRIPHNAKVFNKDSSAKTLIVVGEDLPAESLKRIPEENVSFVACPRTRGGKINLTLLMDILGGRAITSLLLEGGSALMGSMIRERLIDKFYIFKGSKIFGGSDGIPMASGPGPEKMDNCLHLKNIKVRRFEDDMLIRGYPVWNRGDL